MGFRAWGGVLNRGHRDRSGVAVKVLVKLRGSRKRGHDISGLGDTTEEAAQKLIDGLDIWAEALR